MVWLPLLIYGTLWRPACRSGHTVTALDQRGHGESDKLGAAMILQQSSPMIGALILALDIERPILVGIRGELLWRSNMLLPILSRLRLWCWLMARSPNFLRVRAGRGNKL